MSVEVKKLGRPPTVTGNSHRDLLSIHKYMEDIYRSVNQLRERTGGSTDQVAATATAANEAAATSTANSAGAVIPAAGGAVELTPTDPLSYTIEDSGFATINIAGHTRTGAGAPLVAGTVASVARGFTWWVYYVDVPNAGGAQTFLANQQTAPITAIAGYRIIGNIYVPLPAYTDRETGA